jgi:carbon-monoxide dehydrogenase iron sulfur subunit/anaerobic dimethyl sulfoxide reductase subunit B (iron-sulfur subunit)
MKNGFHFDVSKCSGCGACAVACMDQNDIDIAGGQAPLRRITETDSLIGDAVCTCVSIACMHCNNAPCVAACPRGCITKNPETDLTVYDDTDCVGCRNCAEACPFDAPVFGPDGKMQKCNGCFERVRRDMAPACTGVCPTGALTFRQK